MGIGGIMGIGASGASVDPDSYHASLHVLGHHLLLQHHPLLHLHLLCGKNYCCWVICCCWSTTCSSTAFKAVCNWSSMCYN
jgi:hypothetical protein